MSELSRLDLEMPGPAKFRSSAALEPALKSGQISHATLDERVRRNLQLLQRTGKFSDRKTTPEEQSVDLPEHRALIREAGAEGIVLLKNENNILPIDPKKCKKIALVGPLADYAAAHGGGSASLNCHYKISPLEAMKSRYGSDINIKVAKGQRFYFPLVIVQMFLAFVEQFVTDIPGFQVPISSESTQQSKRAAQTPRMNVAGLLSISKIQQRLERRFSKKDFLGGP